MNFATITQLLLLGMIWGSSFLFQRITVPVLGVAVTAVGRIVLAALVLAAVLAATRRRLRWHEHWRSYLLIGLIGSGFPFLLFAFAAHSLPAGYSAVLNATVPLFTVLIGWAAGSRPSTSKLLGVVVGIFGVVTLVRFGAVQLNWMTLAAFAGTLLASVFYAFNARTVKARFAHVDPLVVAAGAQVGAALPLLPWVAVSPPTQAPTIAALLSLIALGLVCTGLAYALFYRLIRDAGSERAVTVTFIVPVFALIWGAMFLGEAITWSSALGCGLVLFAVALIFEKIPGIARPAAPVPVLAKPCRNAS
jgi:drug/metabolite transporter (DMT)-like permease